MTDVGALHAKHGYSSGPGYGSGGDNGSGKGGTMMDAAINLICLDEAVLCEECSQLSRISEGRGQECPGCGSSAIALLRPMLDRTLRQENRKIVVEAGI